MDKFRKFKEMHKDPSQEGFEIVDAIQHMAGCSWDEKKCENVQRFQYGDYPEIIYVIKTGFKNEYLVVSEDAYHLHLGKTKLMTKQKVEKTYNIKIR